MIKSIHRMTKMPDLGSILPKFIRNQQLVLVLLLNPYVGKVIRQFLKFQLLVENSNRLSHSLGIFILLKKIRVSKKYLI